MVLSSQYGSRNLYAFHFQDVVDLRFLHNSLSISIQSDVWQYNHTANESSLSFFSIFHSTEDIIFIPLQILKTTCLYALLSMLTLETEDCAHTCMFILANRLSWRVGFKRPLPSSLRNLSSCLRALLNTLMSRKSSSTCINSLLFLASFCQPFIVKRIIAVGNRFIRLYV